MADVKQLYTLQTDDEFTRLSFPLSKHDLKVLEDDILKNGCNTPIRVWNSYIVMDFETYEICHKHKIPFSIVKIPLKERIEVIAFICQMQIKERKMTESMWRYLVGKRYDCERVLGKHTTAKSSSAKKEADHHLQNFSMTEVNLVQGNDLEKNITFLKQRSLSMVFLCKGLTNYVNMLLN